MTLTALRDDALSSTEDGFALRLGLPWIRSLPLASLDAVEVVVDGERAYPLTIALGDRLADPAESRRSAAGGSCRIASSFAGHGCCGRAPTTRRLVPARHPLPAGGTRWSARSPLPPRALGRARCPGIRPLRLPRCRLTGKDPP